MDFLVVQRDLWSNKESFFTDYGELGDTIRDCIINVAGEKFYNEWAIENFDINKYNSYFPFDQGTFGLGFYDLDVVISDGEWYEYMIFYIGEEEKMGAQGQKSKNEIIRELEKEVKKLKAEINRLKKEAKEAKKESDEETE